MKKVVIASAKRTPIGSFQGNLSQISAISLASSVIKAVLEDSTIDKSQVDEVIMGNVISTGLGQAPARQAALKAGLPNKVECMTINKVCGSSLKSVMLADQAIKCGDADIIIAGGMESMSNVPYILPKARTGLRLGNAEIKDVLLTDALWDVYNDIHMGSCAESCAREFGFSRDQLDEFTVESYNRAINAQGEGAFHDEIIPVAVKSKKDEFIVGADEEPTNVRFDKIPLLRPAFEKDGVITAANSSKLNDGAAALIITSEEKAIELGLTPLVEIVAQASAAKEPIQFTTAPADAINKVLKKAKMTIHDIDLFEINEAFAAVSLAVNHLLEISIDKVNVNGGAVALGHPIGASGARILVTLIHAMKKRKLEYGIASLCIGGGEAAAVIVKNYNY